MLSHVIFHVSIQSVYCGLTSFQVVEREERDTLNIKLKFLFCFDIHVAVIVLMGAKSSCVT